MFKERSTTGNMISGGFSSPGTPYFFDRIAYFCLCHVQ